MSQNRLVTAILGGFFAFMSLFMTFLPTQPVFADPIEENTTTITTENEQKDNSEQDNPEPEATGETCEKKMGAIGWWVCPGTGKISEAVDWLYDKIQDLLVINPISTEDSSPIYNIWKYCRDITNIVFVIFLLVVIYSQITGLGIDNYGVKKALPKLIVAAVLVNLSFLICSLAVDVSNVVGQSLRGVFTMAEEAAIANMPAAGETAQNAYTSFSGMFSAIAGGTSLAIGAGVLAFENGAIWMLIPLVLGAVVAVASGLITIALRQAVVALLIMIAPLAMVAYILPNTEQYFKKWKDLLLKMLVFYPMFSLLFGASHLAGFAIVASAKDGFGVLLGMAVQVLPLFLSWSLMKMSGTILGTVNEKLRGLADKPLAANRAWADSHRQLSKQKYLANNNMPSARLSRFLADRKTARELETKEYDTLNKNRGTAYHALKHYDKKGLVSGKGKRAYEMQARNMRYLQMISMDQDNLNRGLSDLPSNYSKYIAKQRRDLLSGKNDFSNVIEGGSYSAELAKLDAKNIQASDALKAELSRGAKIEYENAKGLYARTDDAINAHIDKLHAGDPNYQLHSIENRAAAEKRYESLLSIMEGKTQDVHFAGIDNAYSFNSQAQIMQGKAQKYFGLGLPSADIVRRLQEFTLRKDVKDNMDIVVPGLRILNQYGDTDVVTKRLYEILEDPDGTKKVDLGSYASQSLASFCMFDVKDSDPILRRFGKYINVETARIYNEADPRKRRHNSKVTFNEYINGEYEEYDVDEQGNVLTTTHMAKPKYAAPYLLEGTSFKNMERTAIANMTETIRNASYETDKNGNKVFNFEKFKETQDKIWNAIMPNIIGDQFSFLSGSEQIKALAKGITGVDVTKHSFDWDGIFGKDLAASLTDDQKKDYMKFLNKRTKTFLNGHVPNQLARTKSDMLLSVLNLLTMSSAAEEDASVMNKDKISKEQYEDYEKKYNKKVSDKFRDSFKEETLKGFAKMYHKGYQGDTKANLADVLHPEELYKKYFGSGDGAKRARKEHVDDEDEDGIVATDEEFDTGDIDASIHEAEIEKIYMERAGSAEDFYFEAMNYLNNHHLSSVAREFDEYYRNNSTASRADLFTYLQNLL